MYSILIDAKERRDVATPDVVGAYLNADMDKFTRMKFTGEAVDINIYNSRKPYMDASNLTCYGMNSSPTV
jgi:hypothetical protein